MAGTSSTRTLDPATVATWVQQNPQVVIQILQSEEVSKHLAANTIAMMQSPMVMDKVKEVTQQAVADTVFSAESYATLASGIKEYNDAHKPWYQSGWTYAAGGVLVVGGGLLLAKHVVDKFAAIESAMNQNSRAIGDLASLGSDGADIARLTH